MVDGLLTNNVLRGSWAEHVVAHHLGDDVEFADQWSYFDLKWHGTKVSVKHSVNTRANFQVKRIALAWDAELASQRQPKPYTEHNAEGWRGHEDADPQYWCDLYVFAWLPVMSDINTVLDPSAWRFAALSRADMYEQFAGTAKSTGRSSLATIGRGFVPGEDLAAAATERLHVAPGVAIPPLDDRTREMISVGLTATTWRELHGAEF
jgi:hypothetical protein